MNVLITGASGFLGRSVTAAIVARGHSVIALVRDPERASTVLPSSVRLVEGDLRVPRSLAGALDGVDAVIHLAACVVGDDDEQLASSVVGAENLLAAMDAGGVRRLIYCGTLSVYDWRRAKSPLDEESPLESDLYTRDGYAISKTWQERIVRRWADAKGTQLTVLRPGFVWGAGNEETSGVGQPIGPLRIVFGGARPLPLTYVENCAAAFAEVLDSTMTIGQTYNVIDAARVTAWRHEGRYLRNTAAKGWRIYVPYLAGLTTARVATWFSRALYRGRGKLPGILTPCRYRARFRPLRFNADKLREAIGAFEAFDYDEAWRHCRLAPVGVATPTADTVVGEGVTA
ncbi:3 beta-hydroxysteroid dehydrogenase/Delta 5--_4-isomerase [Botrimarina colliarenosi]|uniref:3 beta-hydroxysteroid dehydrogenase/Delta 5-->4-isomerase n=1 Tax=Botrimarina colliarenosi TaxID=2528001 RepID=A0A5C6ADW6_9BACT|nr:NAD(P)-dependent oxidoreductase [Botrimarina colliarenosi]TWT97610.1 3 beta-hydroxysteroid dehydrogenase/Delta 5-->4-isomerase [Botrimarina colliarenosi]